MFPLKVDAPENNEAMSVTVEVSQIEISPYIAVAVALSVSHKVTAEAMLPVVIDVAN
jgi:hypothetical protein